MSYQNNHNSVITNEMVYVFMGLAAIFGLKFGYTYFQAEINTVLFAINKIEIYPFALAGMEEAQQALEKIQAAKPGNYDFEIVQRVFAFVGRYFRWVSAGILLVLTFNMWRAGIGSGYARKLTMEKLLHENAKHYPSLRPLVGRNLLAEDMHKGPWRVAQQPIQFAVENGLLEVQDGTTVQPDEILDKKSKMPLISSPLLANDIVLQINRSNAEKIFIDQLGLKFDKPIFTESGEINIEIIDQLPCYIQGLIAVFVAQGSGAQGREKAIALLDQMAETFQEGGLEKIKKGIVFETTTISEFHIDTTGARDLIREYGNREELRYAIKNHTVYLSTWMMALYVYARKKGLLPSSLFLWLRPTDRILWYTLNQVGSNTGWSEAGGPWNHYYAEKTLGRTLNIPVTMGAVDALEQALIETNWLPEPPEKETGEG